MNKRVRELICIILCILIIWVALICCVKMLTPKIPPVSDWITYEVLPGDTLWNISPRSSQYDTRVIIDMIIEHNNLSSGNLIAYSTIEIPVLEVK